MCASGRRSSPTPTSRPSDALRSAEAVRRIRSVWWKLDPLSAGAARLCRVAAVIDRVSPETTYMDRPDAAVGFSDVTYDQALARARELIPFLREQAPKC